MKKTKKWISILLTVAMLFTLAVPAAFAAAMEGDLTGGSITINNPAQGETYNAYQILYLESYDPAAGAYAYKANSEWAEWLANQTDYVTIDAQGYVTWVDGASAADFAKFAREQIDNKTVAGSIIATADNTPATISGLKLGYYIVDSTMGSLCALDTTNPDVTIEEKNEQPTINKEVQEDSNDSWGDKNDADISQTVNFKTTVHAKPGAQDYVVHDKMSDGLTFGSAISVKVGDTALAEGTDYNVVSTGLTDGCTFHVVFTQKYLNTITTDTDIAIEYTATLNENAIVGSPGNENEIWLDYGDGSHTEHDKTTTYTWELPIYKYTKGENNAQTPLAGAEFVLYKTVDGKNMYAQVVNRKPTGWTETKANAATLTSGTDGKVRVEGLDADTYYLEETKAPAGYNKLSEPVTVVISHTVSADGKTMTNTIEQGEATITQVEIENKTGTELPSTGGMGTTLFYALGSVLVIGAGVLLVTRRRMSFKNK